MTETAEPRDRAKETVAMTAATMGHDIVAAMLHELRTLPDMWTRLNEDTQQKSIERMKDKATTMVRQALTFMLASDFKAVPAKLESVGKKGSIRAAITVDAKATYRHALFDAEGQHVIVLMADPAEWFTRMDEIKAKGNQLELFDPDANYNPAVDQPGYRRDLDPMAPGTSWGDLKKTFGLKDSPAPAGDTKPPAAESNPPQGETAAPVCGTEIPKTNGLTCTRPKGHDGACFGKVEGGGQVLPDGALESVDTSGPSLTPAQEGVETMRMLQESLTAIGIVVSLGLLKDRSGDELVAAALWVQAYSEDKGACQVAMPSWLPDPTKPLE